MVTTNYSKFHVVLVIDILSHSPILADALRVFVSQERKDMFVKFQDVVRIKS